jgi:hypothetical protein
MMHGFTYIPFSGDVRSTKLFMGFISRDIPMRPWSCKHEFDGLPADQIHPAVLT